MHFTLFWLKTKFFLFLQKNKKIFIYGDSEIIRETNYFLSVFGIRTFTNKKKITSNLKVNFFNNKRKNNLDKLEGFL